MSVHVFVPLLSWLSTSGTLGLVDETKTGKDSHAMELFLLPLYSKDLEGSWKQNHFRSVHPVHRGEEGREGDFSDKTGKKVSRKNTLRLSPRQSEEENAPGTT